MDVGEQVLENQQQKERLPRPLKERREENERGPLLFSAQGKNEEAVSKVMWWWRTEERSTEKYAHPAGHTHTHTQSQEHTYMQAERPPTIDIHDKDTKQDPQRNAFIIYTPNCAQGMHAYM